MGIRLIKPVEQITYFRKLWLDDDEKRTEKRRKKSKMTCFMLSLPFLLLLYEIKYANCLIYRYINAVYVYYIIITLRTH